MGKASCRASGKTQGPHPSLPAVALAKARPTRPGVSVRSGRVRLVHPEAEELFALDEALRAEGQRVLADSGIGAIIDEAGFAPVGSQAMRTMTWRDLDFERPESPPDWEQHWEIGRRLAMTGWCVRLNCVNATRESPQDPGLYWGLRVAHPDTREATPKDAPSIWKLDLWRIPPDDFERNHRQCERWLSLMTEEKRASVLAIKRALCYGPEYRRTVLSIHIYRAVLEHGVGDLPAFRTWWEENVPQRPALG